MISWMKHSFFFDTPPAAQRRSFYVHDAFALFLFLVCMFLKGFFIFLWILCRHRVVLGGQ